MIRDVQSALTARGFVPGKIDGRVGPKTTEAVKAFQRSRGLVADGVLGPKTLAALGINRTGFLDRIAFDTWAPDAVPGTFDALETAIRKYPVLAEGRVLDDWLGQMWVESAGFSTLVENLNYDVVGLRKTFGQHRISDAECARYGRRPGHPANQEAIANIVYGGEWGRQNLGNTQPGDGWKFRGSGVKQITGRANTEASGFTPEELREDIVKSVEASAEFFIDHGCVPLARLGDITGVTKKVNGGTNGLALRTQKTATASKVILPC